MFILFYLKLDKSLLHWGYELTEKDFLLTQQITI